MNEEFLEFEKSKKIKILNLDNFSIEELKKYIIELKYEIERVDKEINKKQKIQLEAGKLFK